MVRDAMRILLVDDHQLFSNGLRMLLQELAPGVEILTAQNVAQALRVPGPLDLVLLDLHLPDAQGLDGLARIRQQWEGTPVVIVSADDNPAHIRQCIQQGAMAFVSKTAPSSELFIALQRVLAGETYLPPGSMLASIEPAGPQVHLSPRQHEVLAKVVQGKSNKVIARELGISDTTVCSHVAAVLTALDAHTRTEAVYRAASIGLPMAMA
jgi:two-component system nitrate/nitrite response regulator NarL